MTHWYEKKSGDSSERLSSYGLDEEDSGCVAYGTQALYFINLALE